MNNREYEYTYITSGATTTVFTGKGVLHSININQTPSGVVRIVDNNIGTTANVGILPASAVVGTRLFDISISKGLIIDQAGTSDLTVAWSQA